MTKELYKKHRPRSLKKIIGQDSAVNVLSEMIEENRIPHTILFTGPSGVGKTTIARILKKELNCGKYDFNEMNCADLRGIDDVRRIRDRINQAPLNGDCRIWLVDECHKMTKDAQNAFLKMLEDTPEHVYFFLATTDPQKIIKTIKTRCTPINLKPISESDLTKLLKRTIKDENKKIPENVIQKIVENSEGSARQAMVFLNQIIGLKKKREMLEVIIAPSTEVQAIEIARALFNTKTNWSAMAKILTDSAKEEPEQIRWMVLGYAKAVLLKASGKKAVQAHRVIESFRDHFYDCKHAGLVAACYEIIVGE